MAGRRGYLPEEVAHRLTARGTGPAAAMLLHAGLADAAICAAVPTGGGRRNNRWPISRRLGVTRVYGLGCLILQHGTLFLCDTQMVVDPPAEQVAEMMLGRLRWEPVRHNPESCAAVALEIRRQRFGVARKMRRALALVREKAPAPRGGW